MDILISVF